MRSAMPTRKLEANAEMAVNHVSEATCCAFNRTSVGGTET